MPDIEVHNTTGDTINILKLQPARCVVQENVILRYDVIIIKSPRILSVVPYTVSAFVVLFCLGLF